MHHHRDHYAVNLVLKVIVDSTDLAEIQQSDLVVLKNEDVPRVGISVEDAITKDHLDIHVSTPTDQRLVLGSKVIDDRGKLNASHP